MGAEGTTHKYHNGRTPDDTARNKARFLKALAAGMRPDLAADHCRLGYSTVYEWKRNDPEFDEKWKQAHVLGLDKLEFAVYTSGMEGNIAAATLYLKARRPEVFGNVRDESAQGPNEFMQQISDEEHRQRLERMGLMPRLIEMREGDYEASDVDVPSNTGNGSPSSSDSGSSGSST